MATLATVHYKHVLMPCLGD